MATFRPNVELVEDGESRGFYLREYAGEFRTYTDSFVWWEGGRSIQQREIEASLAGTVADLQAAPRQKKKLLLDDDDHKSQLLYGEKVTVLKAKGDWATYERRFLELMAERRIEASVRQELLDGACLLCSEDKPQHCHRRLVAEYLSDRWGNVEIVHV